MKVLIVNLMQIGDLVLTTPVFRAIKSNHPNFFLAAVVNKSFASLLQFNPFINQLLLLDKSSWRSFIRILRTIRHARFDLCLNLNLSERAQAIAALSNANRIIGYAHFPFSLRFNIVCPNRKRSIHQIKSHFKVLDAAGFHLPIPQSDVFIGNTSVEHFIRDFPPNSKIVAFNVGASWSSKRWLPQSFASVANHLINRGFHVAFLGSIADIPIVDQCLAFIPKSNNLHVLTGKLSLLELAAFFDMCCLLITNDSGPMHIAAARNLPAVSIFGSSPTVGFAPWNSSHIVLKSPAPCHPCYKHSCPLTGNAFMQCMKLITPHSVLHYSLQLLARPSPPPVTFDSKIIHLDKQK